MRTAILRASCLRVRPTSPLVSRNVRARRSVSRRVSSLRSETRSEGLAFTETSPQGLALQMQSLPPQAHTSILTVPPVRVGGLSYEDGFFKCPRIYPPGEPAPGHPYAPVFYRAIGFAVSRCVS